MTADTEHDEVEITVGHDCRIVLKNNQDFEIKMPRLIKELENDWEIFPETISCELRVHVMDEILRRRPDTITINGTRYRIIKITEDENSFYVKFNSTPL